jgi:hypothetical protein
VGLDEDAVDLLEVHDAGLVAHGFDERAEAQVAGAAQSPFGGHPLNPLNTSLSGVFFRACSHVRNARVTKRSRA